MEFAIVDIETTGGYAAANGITEISIHIHDGKKVIRHYETLINPEINIPGYIRGLTGITNQMVADAPTFNEVAGDIYGLLQGRVFVAHSVNFDYSFIKEHLAANGYELNTKKLCTIRLSRKIFPGAGSYGLGKICGYLGIEIDDRHRAGGDARATVKLFELLQANDAEAVIEKMLKKNSKEQSLPPNVPREQFEALPDLPGIYYFKDNKGKVVYVGKARNLRKRVSSHFSNNSASRQKQDFMRAIHNISFEVCGSELMALVLESHEIKRLWPAFNRSQKRFEPVYVIADYHDQQGYHRLGIHKAAKGFKPLAAFSTVTEGQSLLRRLTLDFELCPRLNGLSTATGQCADTNCPCTQPTTKTINQYNKKVKQALQALARTESFIITQQGRTTTETGVIIVEDGTFTRMGYLSSSDITGNNLPQQLIATLPGYRENFNIRNIIAGYRQANPHQVIYL